MEGGLFGLNNTQKMFLYFSQILPTIIILFNNDIVHILLTIQFLYVIAIWIYVKFLSL